MIHGMGQEIKTDLLLHMVENGLQTKALEILGEDYSVDFQEFHGEVMLSAKTDNDRNMDDFFQLGQRMMEEEVKFTYETESFILESDDFMKLCDSLMGE